MVFGRKAELVKPSPPTVEQILEDLQTAESDDPVYTVSTNIARDIIEEDPESDVNKNYLSVIDYSNNQKKLKQLEVKVNTGFEALESSQRDLEKLTSEVEEQLSNIKETRNKVAEDIPKDKSSVVAVTVEEKAEESEEDLC